MVLQVLQALQALQVLQVLQVLQERLELQEPQGQAPPVPKSRLVQFSTEKRAFDMPFFIFYFL